MKFRGPSIVVIAAVVLSACGGDDSASGGASTDPTIAPATSVVNTGPTIAPDLPEELLPGVGPVAVLGEPLPELQSGGDDPAIGMLAPVLAGETFGGEAVRVDATVDGPTWIVFLAHWCPHCNDEIPVINQLRDDGRIPDGVNVVGVSTAVSPDRPNWPPAEWLADKDWTYTAIADGVDMASQSFIAASAFGVSGFPFSVLVDGDGMVTQRWSGERPADEIVSELTTNLTLA